VYKTFNTLLYNWKCKTTTTYGKNNGNETKDVGINLFIGLFAGVEKGRLVVICVDGSLFGRRDSHCGSHAANKQKRMYTSSQSPYF
jgi:hypothetical protein